MAPTVAGTPLPNSLLEFIERNRLALKGPVTAVMRSAVLMLSHMGLVEVADRVWAALMTTIVERGVRTADVGGTASTSEFTATVVAEL